MLVQIGMLSHGALKRSRQAKRRCRRTRTSETAIWSGHDSSMLSATGVDIGGVVESLGVRRLAKRQDTAVHGIARHTPIWSAASTNHHQHRVRLSVQEMGVRIGDAVNRRVFEGAATDNTTS